MSSQHSKESEVEKAAVAVYLAIVLFILAFWGAVGYVALHFLLKVW